MAMTLISTSTFSDSASVSITSGIDSTYKLYMFHLFGINLATNNAEFQFNVSTDGGSNYNLSKQSTCFQIYQPEDDSDRQLQYVGGGDLANGTGDQELTRDSSSDADASLNGTMWLFNPSNSTYVKHFCSTISNMAGSPYEDCHYVSGYVNSTSDVDAIIFRTSSGNFDGTISMYGVG